MRPLVELIGEALEKRKHQDRDEKERKLTDLIDATFGPNPCQSFTLTNEDGTTLQMACNNKRCVHCGPRKKAMIQHQMKAFGDYAFLTTFDDRIELDRAIGTARKAAQRAGSKFLAQSVGDSTLGYILVTNRPILPEQRLTTLADWTRRIIDTYHHSVQRIRRSQALGRVSLLRRRRKPNPGQTSPWHHRTIDTDGMEGVQDLDWQDELAEIEWREGVLLTFRPPDPDLPVPF